MLMNLLTNIWLDLHEPKVLWQLGVAALCVLASYLIAQALRRRFQTGNNHSEADVITEQLFVKMWFPIVLFLFLYLGKSILFQWQHIYLFSLLIPLCGAWALVRFGLYLSRRIFVRSQAISSLHLLIEKLFSFSVWIAVLFYYTGILQDMWVFMDAHTITIGRSKPSISAILQALISVAITVLLALWASAALDKRLMKVSSLHTSLRIVLSRVGRFLLLVCAVLLSLNLVGIDLTVLSIFSGALGIGLGLGLQKIASNYVSGFIILLDRSLTIGDMITVDRYSGKVSEINTRYSVLKGLDGVESVIPNEMLVSSPVQNLSLTDRAVQLSTDLTVAYSTDIEALLPMLVDAVSSVERVSTELAPAANLVKFGNNGLELNIGFWINDPENGRAGVSSQVNRAIWKLLQEKNIEVPYPQTEVRVLGSVSDHVSDHINSTIEGHRKSG